jgi:hypothetical protein
LAFHVGLRCGDLALQVGELLVRHVVALGRLLGMVKQFVDPFLYAGNRRLWVGDAERRDRERQGNGTTERKGEASWTAVPQGGTTKTHVQPSFRAAYRVS